MRITFIISFLLHIFILFGLQKAIPINWFAEPLPFYHVELLRPPVDMLDESGISGADLDTESEDTENEDTISLDTKDKRYSSYAQRIKERLSINWEYPEEAKDNLIEGRVLVVFKLERAGGLLELKIVESSSSDILDSETERVIRVSAPYPPFPGSVTVKRLNIKANFSYVLTNPR